MVRHERGYLVEVVVVYSRGPAPAPTAAECDKMQSGIRRPLQSRIGPRKEHVRGTMACPSRSGRAWVTAAMFIGQLRWQSGGDGSALFRQELGLSSDSKILLIYDISTPVFPPTPLTPTDKRPAGRRWHSAKLFVCLPLTFTTKDRFHTHANVRQATTITPHRASVCCFFGKAW